MCLGVALLRVVYVDKWPPPKSKKFIRLNRWAECESLNKLNEERPTARNAIYAFSAFSAFGAINAVIGTNMDGKLRARS